MRTIEGWTDEEIKALKRLKDGGYDVYNTIVRYMHWSSDGILSNKLIWGNRTENNQLIYDIVDYWRGDAEFPKKKYQIKFSFTLVLLLVQINLYIPLSHFFLPWMNL